MADWFTGISGPPSSGFLPASLNSPVMFNHNSESCLILTCKFKQSSNQSRFCLKKLNLQLILTHKFKQSSVV